MASLVDALVALKWLRSLQMLAPLLDCELSTFDNWSIIELCPGRCNEVSDIAQAAFS